MLGIYTAYEQEPLGSLGSPVDVCGLRHRTTWGLAKRLLNKTVSGSLDADKMGNMVTSGVGRQGKDGVITSVGGNNGGIERVTYSSSEDYGGLVCVTMVRGHQMPGNQIDIHERVTLTPSSMACEGLGAASLLWAINRAPVEGGLPQVLPFS